ncbi:MAG: hypothetical protein SF097_06645 [Acidobacteriota bacterium]|nr:hypothetical protein [Acidobacteriota bacterium]
MTTHTKKRYERVFFTGIAIASAAVVFVGFARTYYLKEYFGTPHLSALLHLHGLIFTSWVALFLTQSLLVATNRTNVHRRLGMIGAFIAILLVILGLLTALIRTKQRYELTGDKTRLSFLAIPLGDMLLFACFVGAGFYYRRRTDVHKRLMLFATIMILDAAFARILKAGSTAFFGATDLFIVGCLTYDLITRKRIHQVTLWCGLVVIASQMLRIMIGRTQAWIDFSLWLVQWF